MMKPYQLVFITNVISEGSGEPVLLCNLVGVTQSFGVDEESKHLRTPTNKLCFKCACINFISKFHQNAHAISAKKLLYTLYIRWNFLSNKDDTDEPSEASS